jgi:hypothetical protein
MRDRGSSLGSYRTYQLNKTVITFVPPVWRVDVVCSRIAPSLTPEPDHVETAEKCIFCDNFADSKEHIWAEWMLPHLPKKGVSSHEVYSEVIFSKHSAVTITKRSGEPQSGRLCIVCEDCNTGWMSDLQKAAKPILWGAARIIETPG